MELLLDELPAISIRQPWASLLAMTVVDHYSITWQLDHRGPLAIHANGRESYVDATVGWNKLVAAVSLGQCPLSFPLPQAAVIAIVQLDDCRPADEGMWELQVSSALRARHPLFRLGQTGLWMWRPPLAARDSEFWQHASCGT